jgi:hypothetical protein
MHILALLMRLRSTHADMLEPDRPAVLTIQPRLSIRKPARRTATALGRIGAIEEGDMLVADITEPSHQSLAKCKIQVKREYTTHQ